MSCRKCGYRFRWELKEGNENNKCPKCTKKRGWKDEDDGKLKSGKELRSYYYKRTTDAERVRHPARIDVVSTSKDSALGLGEPRIHELSTSTPPLHPHDEVSTGWRPWSKLSTYSTSAPCEKEAFDRTYSRNYMRNYSMPYNVNNVVQDFSYPTGYISSTTSSRFNISGTNREVEDRPGRDYKALIPDSLRVKSFNRKIANVN
eukprot:TRINITY_DN12088_c0_g1_i1.p1 TRINITY_DN12088_c0_g1~~TRINITY_DN12088_c0_g1_i1.p1  ORF type:complete len:203 (+),score=31.10 TRINITY_DN12088_c0_g1_i1:23-631(+)